MTVPITMAAQSNESLRLVEALRAAGFAHPVAVRAGTSGVASPSRLACEWIGFRVVIEQVEYYAKVLHDDMRPCIDIEKSAEASRAAAAAGVAPPVTLIDVPRGVFLFKALPAPQWRTARLDDLARMDRLETLWALKRQLHTAVVAPAVSRSLLRSLPNDVQRIRVLSRQAQVPVLDEAAWLDECVDRACDALRAVSYQPVLVHGDGVASNVMIDADGEMRLVDFDRSGYMDPWYDVATTLNELFQFEEAWRAGIVSWAGTCREADYARCRLYALVDDWLWTLTANWAGAVSARPLEFTKLAQWTLLRSRMTVRDPRFENWLRQVQGESL